MRGQPERIDNGNVFDALLRALSRLGSWASKRREVRMLERRNAVAMRPGTRIRITGACCATSYRGRVGTIHSYVDDADDYRVTLDGEPNAPGRRLNYHTYVCALGVEVLNGG